MMKKSTIVILSIVAFICIIMFAVFLYITSATSKLLVGQTSYGVSANLGDYVGFNLQTDRIYFGTVMAGGYSQRKIMITAQNDGFIVLKTKGPLARSMYVYDDDLYAKKGEEITIELYLKPYKRLKPGSYESDIYVYVLNEKNDFVEWFLPGREINRLTPGTTFPGSGFIALNITNPDNSTS